jgi:signal transduction histidine kinase
LLNGDINVRSKVDEGTTFTITLPLVVSEQNVEKWRNL